MSPNFNFKAFYLPRRFSIGSALGFVLLPLFTASTGWGQPSHAQVVEQTITEDALNSGGGVRWGGRGWPFSELTAIEETLVGSPVGRIVLDRHGVGSGTSSFSWIGSRFSAPDPGRTVFISAWGSKYEGCFVELIVQRAPVTPPLDASAVIPVQLDIGVNGQVIQLTANANDGDAFQNNYTYTNYEDGESVEYSSTWYMGRQVFPLDATIAQLLGNAPAEEVRTRVTFANDTAEIYRIGDETVRRWQGAYSFNRNCQSPGQTFAQAPASPSSNNSPVAQSFVGQPSNSFTAPQTILAVEGIFDENTPRLNDDNSPFQAHIFQGMAGDAITITMTSNDFDAYLLLVDPNGEAIAQNDDMVNGNLNAQIVIELTTTGEYRAIANSRDETGRGGYRLTIQSGI